MEHIRKMAVAGTFYAKRCTEIRQRIAAFNREFNTHSIPEAIRAIHPQAIIVPHAGYMYSGYTANFAYRFLQHTSPKRIIVIGPSHHIYYKGISGSFFEQYQTPCGNLDIDSAYLFALAKRFPIGFVPKVHQKEHSTEVQMPFIQHYFPHTPVIELIYGDIGADTLANLMVAILQNPDNRLIVSSDLSHFYTKQKAHMLDKHCLLAVQNLDIVQLASCEACGITGIKALILAAKHIGLTSMLLDYTTSAKSTGDSRSVVGYMSAMFYLPTHSLATKSASKR